MRDLTVKSDHLRHRTVFLVLHRLKDVRAPAQKSNSLPIKTVSYLDLNQLHKELTDMIGRQA